MARIGQKLMNQIKRETRRYNTIVNRYNRQNSGSQPAAKITNAQILNSGMKADEIRLQLKLMSLLQSEKDFVRPSASQPNAYEMAQFDYLRKRQKAALTREFSKIQKDVLERVAKGEIVQTNVKQIGIKAEIANLTKTPRSGPSLLRQLERAKRRQFNKAKFGSYDSPDWVEVSREHFLAALSKASIDNTEAGREAVRIIEQMSNKQFQEFLISSPNITLELAYNTDLSIIQRANQILTAIEGFLQSRPDIEIERDDNEEDYFWVS